MATNVKTALTLFLTTFLTVSTWAASDFYDIRSSAPHELEFISSGTYTFKSYLDCIRSAKKTIILESFSINNDDSTILLLKEMIRKKAERSEMDIRILIENYGYDLSQFLEQQLSVAGIPLKVFTKKTLSLGPYFHRKTLICDNTAFIGGRNLGDYNFQMQNPRYDYTLRITGPIVRDIQRTFEPFWQDSRAILKFHRFIMSQELTGAENLQKRLSFMRYKPGLVFRSSNIRFVSDSPQSPRDRFVVDSIKEELSKAQEDVVIETPSFWLGDGKNGIYESVIKPCKVPYRIYKSTFKLELTNVDRLLLSLHSTLIFEPYGGGVSFRDVISENVTGYIVDPRFSSANLEELEPLDIDMKSSFPKKILYHNKLVMVDHRHVFVTSFNFEALSENENIEMGLWVYDVPELAEHVEKLIEKRGFIELWRK